MVLVGVIPPGPPVDEEAGQEPGPSHIPHASPRRIVLQNDSWSGVCVLCSLASPRLFSHLTTPGGLRCRQPAPPSWATAFSPQAEPTIQREVTSRHTGSERRGGKHLRVVLAAWPRPRWVEEAEDRAPWGLCKSQPSKEHRQGAGSPCMLSGLILTTAHSTERKTEAQRG